jgi:serine protease AprX
VNKIHAGLRGNALWGRGGRGSKLAMLAAVSVLALAAADVHLADAATTKKKDGAFIARPLMNAAQANPGQLFNVIVQAARGDNATTVGAEVDANGLQSGEKARNEGHWFKKKFGIISGVSAQLTGKEIVKLAKNKHVAAITLDYKVARTSYSNPQLWPDAAQVSSFWPSIADGALTPTVAVVDSGIDNAHPDIAGQVLASATFVSNGANTADGDGRGHGTFVAGILAGSAEGHAGAAPGTKLVSVDVLNDEGSGMLSDVIAGAQWILDNKDAYGIRVANFSLNAGNGSSFRWDPLDKAVEKLWFNGVVVVVAAGNYGSADGTHRVHFAPANDPFVITVGASDTNETQTPGDDFAAPWSAWGYTYDGFQKPDIAAPGRGMDGPVPDNAQLLQLHPERATTAGHMWLSGTSMAAPVVSGAAATLLAQHPLWTPDQVKGALLATAALPDGYTAGGSLGRGVLQAGDAAASDGLHNPNAGLDEFVTVDPATGGSSFDADAWATAAATNASWDSASWDSASWDSASWDSASWDSASWDSASWESASWESASWDSASWESASWDSASWDSASWDSASWESSTWLR